MNRAKQSRETLLQNLAEAGRENSTATVLFHGAVATRSGMAGSDLKTLDFLTREGPMTAGQIAQRTGLATASVTALIDRLEAKHLVRRKADKSDRRRVMVHAVPAGAEETPAVFRSLQSAFEKLLANYSDAELALLLDALTRSTEMLRAETAKLEQG